METDIETVLQVLKEILAQISMYKGHGNPGCPDRVGAYIAMGQAKKCLELHGKTAKTYDQIHK